MRVEEEIIKLEELIQQMYVKVKINHERLDLLMNDFDVTTALEIIEDDQYINGIEVEINDLSIQILALLQPVAKDLRTVIASIKIATELERIGDYAKNIASVLVKSNSRLFEHEAVRSHFILMHQQVLKMLDASMDALKKSSSEQAFIVGKEDHKVDNFVSSLLQKLDEDHSMNFEQGIFIMKIVRNLERSGDHVMNICEQIIYLDKGYHYEFG